MSDSRKYNERKKRAGRLVALLKKEYPTPKSELVYQTPFQFAVAVILSAQCTDKVVNRVTASLFKKYETPRDFAFAKSRVFEKEIPSIPFFRNKTKSIILSAKDIVERFGGKVPRTAEELESLHGVGYKTAHVVLGELYSDWPGIPTDTHVKRFAHKFDLVDSTDLKKISKELEALIPKKDWKYVNNGLVLYGRYICPARRHDCRKHLLTAVWPEAANRWPKTK